MLRLLSIQPLSQSDLSAYCRHNSQMIQPFIDVFLCSLHGESSFSLDSTLPIFANPVNQTAECGLGMTIVPPFILAPRNKHHKKLLFLIIIKTGISIALWPRELPADPEKCSDMQKKLRSLFSNQRHLSELPEVVLLQRQAAWGSIPGNEQHLGHHLTLLWDDPTRPLPEV